MSPTLSLASELIKQPSITPEDANCQKIIAQRLLPLGFQIESLPFGEVQNLWARRGQESPCFIFLGHTDVVPPGNTKEWKSDPFTPEVREGYLYGRGSADMKASIAAMIVAMEAFIQKQPNFKGSFAFLLTSDEEGPAINGVAKVIEALISRGEKIDWCLVGEPSSIVTVGDTLRVGRRGSLNGELTVIGKQGHVAYPHLAQNPIHLVAPVLQTLTQVEWDKGNAYFPATSFQVTSLQSGTGTTNVIPAELTLCFNFRFCPESQAESLQEKVELILQKAGFKYNLTWRLSGKPFLTQPGILVEQTVAAIQKIKNIMPELSTGGGTSDGRFIAPYGIQVIELGPVNATIHQVNECVSVEELETLQCIYFKLLENLFLMNES